MKESEARMEEIPPTMVLHKHVDGADTTFTTMSGPLLNSPPVKWIGLIIKGSYQVVSEDRRWVYEPVPDLWTDIEPDDNYSVDGSRD